MFHLRCLAALSNVGDVGIVAGVDGVVVVEGGRAVAAVLFLFGCANMTKWSMRSPKVYKPLLLLVIPWARPHFNYIS